MITACNKLELSQIMFRGGEVYVVKIQDMHSGEKPYKWRGGCSKEAEGTGIHFPCACSLMLVSVNKFIYLATKAKW